MNAFCLTCLVWFAGIGSCFAEFLEIARIGQMIVVHIGIVTTLCFCAIRLTLPCADDALHRGPNFCFKSFANRFHSTPSMPFCFSELFFLLFAIALNVFKCQRFLNVLKKIFFIVIAKYFD